MSDAPVSLYRKYRPRRFADVVGQKMVVRTLQEAAKQHAVSHAYLFIGGRGSGKTSLAKILAKALNCENVDETGEPCGVCASCVSIHEATSADVLELDAASNRGIDDVRDLRERVKYKTITGAYRVFIIDEAHMLTREAANALLKTLESPPENVVFILCTTEDHKIMPTIKSRCQRFYFQSSNADELRTVITNVAEQEGITVDETATRLIARHAHGSFRDALTLLEQLRVVFKDNVSGGDAASMLGETPSKSLFSVLQAVFGGKTAAALKVLEELYRDGYDLGQVLEGLYYELHNLVLYRVAPDESEYTPEEVAALKDLSGVAEEATIQLLLRCLATAKTEIARGGDAKVALTLALYKASSGRGADDGDNSGATAASVSLLGKRVDELERSGVAPAPAYPMPPSEVDQAEPSGPNRPAEAAFSLERNLTHEQLVLHWTNLLYELRHLNKVVYAVLRTARPEVRDDKFVLYSWDTHTLERHAKQIVAFLGKHTNKPLAVVTQPYPTDGSESKVKTPTGAADDTTEDGAEDADDSDYGAEGLLESLGATEET